MFFNVKNLEYQQKFNIMFDLVMNKCLTPKEIELITDYESINNIYKDMQLLSLPIRFKDEHINFIYKNIDFEIKESDISLKNIDFINKYSISRHNYKKIQNQSDLNCENIEYLNSIGLNLNKLNELILIRDLNLLKLSNISELYSIDKNDLINLFKYYGIPTTNKYLNKELIMQSLIKSISNNQIYIDNFTKFENGEIDLKEFATLLKLDERVLRDVLRSIFNENDYKELRAKTKRNRTIFTNKQKYGVAWSFQSENNKQKAKATMLEKYGVENAWQKDSPIRKEIEQQNIEKYGAANPFASEIIKNKIKQTMRSKYGVNHQMHINEVKNKISQTSLMKYGSNHHLSSPEIRNKIKQTNLKRYGVDNQQKYEFSKYYLDLINTIEELHFIKINYLLNQSEQNQIAILYDLLLNKDKFMNLYKEYIDYNNSIDCWPNGHLWLISQKNIKLNDIYELEKNNLIKVDHTLLKSSSGEKLLLLKLNDYYNGKIIINDRSILRNSNTDYLELDFYLPDKNLAIEINPSYTHNSNQFNVNHHNGSKDIKYHFNKYKAAQEKNITLIQLFEWDLKNERFENFTWPRLKTLLNIDVITYYGRHVNINEVKDISEVKPFLNQYHSDGYANSSIKYEIRHKNTNELLGAATFVKSQSSKFKGEWELKRLAFKHGIRILGCISKLFTQFFKDYSVNQCITYSNNDWGNGLSYEKAGLKFISETGASLKFVSTTDPTDVYSRHIAMKHGARSGVIADDLAKKGLPKFDDQPFNILEYIETELSHRTDDGKSYDSIYTSGSKLWLAERSNFI